MLKSKHGRSPSRVTLEVGQRVSKLSERSDFTTLSYYVMFDCFVCYVVAPGTRPSPGADFNHNGKSYCYKLILPSILLAKSFMEPVVHITSYLMLKITILNYKRYFSGLLQFINFSSFSSKVDSNRRNTGIVILQKQWNKAYVHSGVFLYEDCWSVTTPTGSCGLEKGISKESQGHVAWVFA